MKTFRFSVCLLAITLLFAGTGLAQTSFPEPLLVTSAGQSVDIKLASVLLNRIGVEYTQNSKAAPEDLSAAKTLLIVPGFSSKGLGSAGISREEELERVRTLIAAAKEAGIPILALHLGGKARRGVQSDEFNQVSVESADELIVVEQGNEDGFFTKICKEKEIPMKVVANMAGALEPLKAAVKP